jgi:parallel beta-helix repeat protein
MAVAGFLIAAAPARAGGVPEICVHDDTGFAAAAVEAQFLPLTIKFVQGTYHLTDTVWHNADYDSVVIQAGSSLRGGYTSGCTGRDIAAENTIMTDGVGSYDEVGLVGDVTIEGLSWHTSFQLIANPDIAPNTRVILRRDVFEGAQNGGFSVYLGEDEDATVRVVDTLIHDASGAGIDGCAFEAFAADGSLNVELINNTVFGNLGSAGICISAIADLGGSVDLFAYNNILYGNTGPDISSNSSALVLVDNVIGTHSYPTPLLPPVGTLTGNPQLNASTYRPIESPPSPVINSGSNTAPGGLPASDLDGGPRVVGTTVDRGAYESSINDAFIQNVTSTSDSGAGSLRSAIAGANAHGSGLITFAIGSSCGPHVITLASALPSITVPVIMNGYTQPGASENTLDFGDDAALCVILEAGNSSVTKGLAVASNAADSISLSVRGVAFSGFSDAAVDLQAGSNHFLGGDHFGGSVGGHSMLPNGTNIRLGIAAHGVFIGGDDVAFRNIIGDATGDGILLQGLSIPLGAGTYNDQIVNNYIGVGWSIDNTYYIDRGNGARGIHVLGHDNTISGNLIGYNASDGVYLDGEGAINDVLDSNAIGAGPIQNDLFDANAVSRLEIPEGDDLGNASMGVRIDNDAHDNIIRYNRIANNGQKGIRVVTGTGNRIRKNSMYDNALLGIDLAGEGVTPNDDDGAIMPDGYANRGQNFPVLTFAGGGTYRGNVTGTLTTTPGDYIVDIYNAGTCDDSGYGEGSFWMKGVTVTVPTVQGVDQGTAAFSISITLPFFLGGEAITATATDAAGDTSEFSACVIYFNDTIFADGFNPPA